LPKSSPATFFLRWPTDTDNLRAIRGLFERERSLPGMLARTAYDSIRNARFKVLPKVVGGRYGLSSKEFTLARVLGIFWGAVQKAGT
jgi:pyruvate/2-oxoacid:ferredoxin oxidoreductase alpha subunit